MGPGPTHSGHQVYEQVPLPSDFYVSMKAFDPSLEAGHEQQPAFTTSALGGVGSLELTGRSAQPADW